MDKINAPILEQAEKTESCPFCSWLIAAEMSIYRDDNYRGFCSVWCGNSFFAVMKKDLTATVKWGSITTE